MKKWLPIILISLIFFVGLGILSYPLISSVVNNIDMRNDAVVYRDKVNNTPSQDIQNYFNEAENYNQSLLNNVILTDPFDEEAYAKIGANYEKTLNIDGNGLIGYIDIPNINVYLPIYHGTSLDVLSKGAGHLENTSMPIGGKSTHSVISAHCAFPTETFFDYLDRLKIGDNFYIHILNKVIKYEVDQIKIVLPEQTTDLNIIEGKDYVTLITCTPYSVNSHRLLVRGIRAIDDTAPDTSEISVIKAGDSSIYFFGYELPYWEAALIIMFVIIIVILIVFLILHINKKKSAKKHLNNRPELCYVSSAEEGNSNEKS